MAGTAPEWRTLPAADRQGRHHRLPKPEQSAHRQGLLQDNRLCDFSDDFLLGRANCGYLYQDPISIDGTPYEYVYVNAFSLMHFSVAD